MNKASQWRLELAKQISKSYAKHPNVDAVVVAGSVAHGWADRYSDIELDIFWSEPPSDQDRLKAMENACGVSVAFHPYEEEEWSEVYKVNGVKIESANFYQVLMNSI